MPARRLVRVALVVLGAWVTGALTAAPAHAQTPSPTTTAPESNNPFVTLEPVTIMIWLSSLLLALLAVLYAVERERRKHER